MPMITDSLSNVKEKYEILEILGSGSYGTVRKCKNRSTGELAAVKTIDKSKIDNLQNLQREIDILKEVDHPHIIKLFDVYEDATNLHLVTEICTGGELYDRVLDKAESEEGHFREEDAGILVRDILDAIRYCHDEAKIVHRDLKPENFLLLNERDDAPIKIIDFGLSRRDDALFGIMQSRVGTPYYVAPEVLSDSYTYKCDIWSIGIITYLLLVGFAPFSGETDLETLELVERATLEFPSPEWDNISEEAKDFVSKLLNREAFQRPTAAEALKHPWIAKHITPPGVPRPRPFDSSNSARSVKSSSVDLRMDSERRSAFQKFLTGLKLRKALHSIATVLTSAEARHLGEVFRRVDQDKDGSIDVEDIDLAVQKGNFSSSLRENLMEMRSTLSHSPRISFDVKPFIAFADRKGKGKDKKLSSSSEKH